MKHYFCVVPMFDTGKRASLPSCGEMSHFHFILLFLNNKFGMYTWPNMQDQGLFTPHRGTILLQQGLVCVI